MGKKKQVKAFSDKKQKQYERVARLQYGPDIVNESIKLWNSYTKEQQQAIQEQGGQIYHEIANAIDSGLSAQSAEVQAHVVRWHDHLRNFYEPTLEILRGLGEIYQSELGFITFFEKIHAELPEYLAEAITQYVNDLENAELERMIAEDEAKREGLKADYQGKAL
jgi:hypothetical protein